MIDRIVLHNIQSHAHTELPLSHGINALIGESNVGKSAVQRGFKWVWKNRPLGNELLSHWATKEDKNGKLVVIEDCWAAVVFSDMRYAMRKKGKDGFNGYEVGVYEDGKFVEKETFHKVGNGDPPPSIIKMFNMEDVNFQGQYDSMFLLSDNGQDVARYFNKLIGLEDGTTAVSLAESRKRKAKRELDTAEEELVELKKQAYELEWVEKAEEIAEKIELTEKKIEDLNNVYLDADQLVQNMESIIPLCQVPDWHEQAEMTLERIALTEDKIEKLDDDAYELTVLEKDIESLQEKLVGCGWVFLAGEKLAEIDETDARIGSLSDQIDDLDLMITKLEKVQGSIQEQDYFEQAEMVLSRIGKIDDKTINVMNEIDDLNLLIGQISECDANIEVASSRYEEYKAQMPDTCGFCGAPIDKEGNHVIQA